MEMNEYDLKLKDLPNLLLPWYEKSRRDLPWRKTKDPYCIWVSEIMLQQTRVDTVIQRYQLFISELPSVADLAACNEDELMKLWEGLGYYSRAHNMKKAAQIIMEQYAGIFPQDLKQIRDLPGIGDYTAGAISSIAFGKPVPAVDGNVLRVLSRYLPSYLDISLQGTKKYFTELLSPVFPKDASSFTQSLMELGALICLPNGFPHCDICPLSEHCTACIDHSWNELPVKTKQSGKKHMYLIVFQIRCGDRIAIRKRPSSGLLKDMWELPNLVVDEFPRDPSVFLKEQFGIEHSDFSFLGDARHVFTHVEWNMRTYSVKALNENELFLWVSDEELSDYYALPTAFRKLLSIQKPEK